MRKSVIFSGFGGFRAVLAALFLLSSVSAAAAGVRKDGGVWIVDDATGYAAVRGNNRNAAREEAKREAFRDAIEKALGAFVDAVTEMENYQVVRDRVFSKAQGIVKKFDIVKETVDADGMMTLVGVCRVEEAAMDGILGPAVIDAMGNPRVMCWIDERFEERYGDGVGASREEKSPFISTTEGLILAAFEKAGYQIIDPEQVRSIMNIDPAQAWDDPRKMDDAIKTLKADVVILGKAYASAHTPSRIKVSGIPLWGVRATVQLKAVVSRSGQQLGSQVVEKMTQGQTVEDGAVRGFQQAAPPAAGSIVHKVAYAMLGAGPGIPGLTVTAKITGVSFARSESLLEALREFAGKGGGVYDREFKDGLLEVDVVSPKNARAVAAFLTENGVEVDNLEGRIVYGRVSRAETEADKGVKGASIGVRITGVPSFDDASELEDALAEFLSDGGEVESSYNDGVLELNVFTAKRARDVASFLSKQGVKITGSSSASVSGEWIGK